MRTTDSHSIIDRASNNRVNYGKDIFISNRVWIGEFVHILKGVFIPNDCVIGKCSVVTNKLFEANSVIAGNPAKTVRRNIYWRGERIN